MTNRNEMDNEDWKEKFRALEKEYDDFREQSQSLERELEMDNEMLEKTIKELKSKNNKLQFDNETLRVNTFGQINVRSSNIWTVFIILLFY